MAAQSVVRLGLESNQYERGIKQARRSFDDFTKGIGAGVLKLTAVSAAITATTTALKVAKDAFFASERNVDEWGRTVEAAKSVYEGFLNSINTGDISGFLSNIDRIVTAARAAYDELDKLGSMKTIQGPEISKQETENSRLRQMIMTRRYIAPGSGTGQTASMAAGTVLSDTQIRVLEKQLQNGMKKVVDLWNNEVKQSTKAIDAEYERQAATLGMSFAEFRRGTSNWAEFDRRVKMAQKYRDWEDEHSYVDQGSGRLARSAGKNPYEAYRAWSEFRVDGDVYHELVRLIQERDAQVNQIYSSQAQAYRTINRAEGITSRIGGGRSGGGRRVGGGAIGPQQMLMLEGMSALTPTGYLSSGGPSMSSADMAAWFSQNMFTKGLADQARQFGWDMQDKSGQDSLWKNGGELLSDINGGIGNIVGGIEQLGIDVPEGLKKMFSAMQGIASILTGISALITIITTIQGAKATPVIGMFLSHGGVAKAAQGLTVPGNLMSGDRVPAMLNSGEVVLNRAQVGNLAAQLSGPQVASGQNGRTVVSGEDIVLAVENYGRRIGRKFFS